MSTLWLVGMMGAGKTTVGSLVASRLGLQLADTDAAVEAEAQASVAAIFENQGEARFRELESRAVMTAAGTDAVVACGGGVVLDAANRQRIRESGLVIWLDAPVEVLVERLAQGAGRPLLSGGEPAERLAEIAAARSGAYAAAAHHRVVTAGRTPDEVAEEVVALWLSWK